MARGQANMNRAFCPAASIIIFKAFSKSVSSDADNGIYLWVKRFRPPQRVNCNAVLLDFVDGSFEVLFTNKRQKSNVVVRPPEYPGRQYIIYFSPLRLKLADCRLQVHTPKNSSSDKTRALCRKYNRIYAAWHRPTRPASSTT